MGQHPVAVLQALFVVFLWSTSRVFVKIGLHDLPPVTFAGLRYFLALVCLLGVLSFLDAGKEIKALSTEVWIKFILPGILLYAGTQRAVFVALACLPAVTVNFLWCFSSLIITLLGVGFLFEQPSHYQWAGMLPALLGAVIYFYRATIPQNQTIGFICNYSAISKYRVMCNRPRNRPPNQVEAGNPAF